MDFSNLLSGAKDLASGGLDIWKQFTGKSGGGSGSTQPVATGNAAGAIPVWVKWTAIGGVAFAAVIVFILLLRKRR